MPRWCRSSRSRLPGRPAGCGARRQRQGEAHEGDDRARPRDGRDRQRVGARRPRDREPARRAVRRRSGAGRGTCRQEVGRPGVETPGGPTGAGLMFQAAPIAIAHPGPAADITAAATKPKLSWLARRALWRRAWRGPVALVLAIGPAALAFSVELPPIGRMLLLLAAVVIF